jgi:hypothetical protein
VANTLGGPRGLSGEVSYRPCPAMIAMQVAALAHNTVHTLQAGFVVCGLFGCEVLAFTLCVRCQGLRHTELQDQQQ